MASRVTYRLAGTLDPRLKKVSLKTAGAAVLSRELQSLGIEGRWTRSGPGSGGPRMKQETAWPRPSPSRGIS